MSLPQTTDSNLVEDCPESCLTPLLLETCITTISINCDYPFEPEQSVCMPLCGTAYTILIKGPGLKGLKKKKKFKFMCQSRKKRKTNG